MDDGDEAPRTDRARSEADGAPEDDFRALAEDWIAIWQSEITAYLTDPETQQAWSAMMALWAGAAQAMMRGMPAAPGFGHGFGGPRPAKRSTPATPGEHERREAPAGTVRPGTIQSGTIQSGTIRPGTDAAPRPAPTAAAPVTRDDEIHRLEQRVAELERGLAERDRRRGAAGEDRRTRRAIRPRS